MTLFFKQILKKKILNLSYDAENKNSPFSENNI